MPKGTADINICGRSDGRPAAVMVHCSLFMVFCLHIMLFRVSRRSRMWCACAKLRVKGDFLIVWSDVLVIW